MNLIQQVRLRDTQIKIKYSQVSHLHIEGGNARSRFLSEERIASCLSTPGPFHKNSFCDSCETLMSGILFAFLD